MLWSNRLNHEMMEVSNSIAAHLRSGKVNTVLRARRDELEVQIAETAIRLQSLQQQQPRMPEFGSNSSDHQFNAQPLSGPTTGVDDIYDSGAVYNSTVARRISYSGAEESGAAHVHSTKSMAGIIGGNRLVLDLTSSWDELPDNVARLAGSTVDYRSHNDNDHNYNRRGVQQYLETSSSNLQQQQQQPSEVSGYGYSYGYEDVNAEYPMCNCDIMSARKTSTQPQSLNRSFFCCSKPRDSPDRCTFFQWEDGLPNASRYDMDSSTIAATTNSTVLMKDIWVALKDMFGHNEFRHGQRECVEAALGGRDVFCLMPTGGGKSMVYQVQYVLLMYGYVGAAMSMCPCVYVWISTHGHIYRSQHG